mmetsp:Transcript_39450/g.122019  ORF Transcript_39450/g.122019 Transcript_39450/m.122019 type:complete len:266 (+) Transcript_39450:709-1506(+)
MRPSRADTSELACVKRKMLSMNRSTSWPSTSRKYSAMVSADCATRARAPGGSFIWPYTSTHLDSPFRSMTLDCIISRYRSVPSRVRSPTPAKTEKPPWPLATLLMSSMMMTVLPTPAPPNRPILPPLQYGRIRSMTLIPVDRMASLPDWSASFGAMAWIGNLVFSPTGPRWSMASPSTLKMRPRVSRPTGTEIWPPADTTLVLSFSRSVVCMAMQRPVLASKCWTISRVSASSRPRSSATSRAVSTGGTPSAKCTSTTAPMTCDT